MIPETYRPGPTMEIQDLLKPRGSRKLLKGCAVLLLLTTLIFMLITERLEIKPKEAPAFKKGPTRPPPTLTPTSTPDFCTFQPLPSAEALEERLILDAIAWPETPLVPAPVSLTQTSDPAHSSFTILPGRGGGGGGGGERRVGDQLEVLINMYDFQGQAKKTGGDFLVARLHNKSLGAGVSGRVVDHLNGSYSAVFPLLWEGGAQVEVTLVHPSEAVTVLRGLTRDRPDMVVFRNLFRSASGSETTTCGVCLRPTNQPQCNFTDLHTGEPWFCYKPQKLSCDTWRTHVKTEIHQDLRAKEERLFQSKVNMKVFIKASGLDRVPVLPLKKGRPRLHEDPGKSELSGYYYQSEWRPLDGSRVHQFTNSSAMSRCLKGKLVHLYGDSTVRQWFEFLAASLPGAKQFDLRTPGKTGPFMMLDYANNFLITFRFQAPPFRMSNVPVFLMRYIANELDRVNGGPNTVVVIGVWAHFSTYPMELYVRRLQSIRRAVVRLLNRAPGTLVVLRTANPKESSLYTGLTISDWVSFQQVRVLRAIFKGLNVRWVDAWEMVLSHHLPHQLHPQPPIIKTMVHVLLSHICPLL